MTTPILIFATGMAMLALFIWYFGTDSAKSKRFIGTILTVLITGFSVFGIFYTNHLPDSYSILLSPVAAEDAGTGDSTDITDSQRRRAQSLLAEALKPADTQGDESLELAIASSKNTISFSRRNLPQEDVEAAMANLEEELKLNGEITHDPKPLTNIKRGIDLQGGSSFVVAIGKTVDGQAVTGSMRDEAIAVFEKRLNEGGTKDLAIATQGDDRIQIQMPGVKPEQIEGIRKRIQQVAKLEFRLANPDSARLLLEKESPDDPVLVPGYEDFPFRPDKDGGNTAGTLLVSNVADIAGDAVGSAAAVYGLNGWEISLRPTGEGSKKFLEVTTPNVGRRLAIIMDGEIISAPVIDGPLSSNISISGDFTLEEAVSLSSALENPLKIKPEIVDERSISATYGENTIKQGITAAIVGLAITLVFCVIYYKIAGLIALFGLCINLVILLGSLAMFDFTLTMPGIAGIILTIGIAIDANVLIYERLREELNAGKSLGNAIKAAYDKAFSAIFDANITTLITAIILFMVASGTVKGFAITLTIGILGSLFAALLVTRVCFRWLVDTGVIKQLNLWNIIPDRPFDFLGQRKIAGLLSSTLVLIAISTFVIKGKSSLGVDFTGGELITIHSQDGLTTDQVRESIADLPFEKFTQSQSSPTGDTFITIRTAFTDSKVDQPSNSSRITNELTKDLGITLDNIEKESVGPVVGRELAKSSLLALVLGLAGIFVYLTFRFEVSFALGAIIALIHDIIITLGVVIILGTQLQLIHVGAFLTIAGYSINDTIVVFDRIRETLRQKRGDVQSLMNLAINQTLGRTLLTSLTTLVVVVTLAIFGGPSLRDFSITIIIGVFIGTYSSIFVASPVVLWWSQRTGRNLRRDILDSDAAKLVDTTGVEREIESR